MATENFDASFDGVGGLTCHEFIKAIRGHAFCEGKSKDNQWMAEIASLRLSGPALKWFEELDNATQEDWALLKRAILCQYAGPLQGAVTRDPDPGMPGDGTTLEFTFEGKDEKEAEKFVQFIRRQAFQADKSEDDKWTADLAGTHLLGQALRWHSALPPTTRKSWQLLERAILKSFSGNIQTMGLNAKRIYVARWNNVVHASALRFPTSEEEWLARGRQRRADMSLPASWKVTWYLVERGEKIPLNGVSVRPETGDLYHIRAWYQGGLTIGKHVPSLARSFIPWYGKELPYDGPFEVLVGDATALRWVCPKEGGFVAVEGGFEAAFESALLVARVKEGDFWEPGKVFSADYRAYFGWYSNEHQRPIEKVEVLAWKT